MRLFLAFAAAQSVGLFLLDSSDAFAPSSAGRRRTSITNIRQQSSAPTTSTSLNADNWDNDDLLESLASSDGEDLPSKDIDGAELSEEMKEKMKKKSEEDRIGGTKFKELLDAAQKATGMTGGDTGPLSLKNPFADNPFAGIEGLDPTANQPSMNPDEMTLEQQAEMFRQMMKNGGPVAQQPVVPLPQPRPPKPDTKTGRNRDADAIQNTADVYFAQLKRDSTVRGVARLRGDIETAEQVFKDPKIKELEEMITKNPHLAEKREEEKKLIERSAEEMMLYQAAQQGKVGDKRESGVSYRKKIEERKKNKSGGGSAQQSAATSTTSAGAEEARLAEQKRMKDEAKAAAEENLQRMEAELKAAAEAKQAEQKRMKDEAKAAAEDNLQRMEAELKAAAEVKQAEQKRREAEAKAAEEAKVAEQFRIEAQAKAAEVAKLAEQKRIEAQAKAAEEAMLAEQKRIEAEAAAKVAAAKAAQPSGQSALRATNSITSSSSNEEIQKGIRTLMGLILKHRGGPGFGAGGLKGAEIGQYEQLLNDVTALLKEESMLHQGAAQATPPPAFASAAPTPTQAANAGLATVPSSPSTFAQVDSMLSCIDGAILMYRNSPPELKEGLLFSIRAALLSAVNTCNKMMGQDEGIPSNSVSSGGNVDSMLACVEGASMMYRNSPPELQAGVLMTLRAALLSAVNTSNKIIAENDVENFQNYQAATVGMPSPPPTPKPTQFYDVVSETPAAAADENSKILEDIYNKLASAAGNGKMGLREDLTADEASELADGIAEMRAIMMEELANGIPETVGATTSGSNDSSSTVSMYQEMLAKAKAEKESKP